MQKRRIGLLKARRGALFWSISEPVQSVRWEYEALWHTASVLESTDEPDPAARIGR